ncbi:hypothetical protein AAHH67_22845 [Niallia circulans]
MENEYGLLSMFESRSLSATHKPYPLTAFEGIRSNEQLCPLPIDIPPFFIFYLFIHMNITSAFT